MAAAKQCNFEASTGISTAAETLKVNEENRKRVIPESTSMTSVQDSGICSNQDPSANERETSLPSQVQSSRENEPSAYVTSTPIKKKVNEKISEFEILPSQMILDDPLLSSIDEPGDLTEHQVDSIVSDDDFEDNYSKLYETKIKTDFDTTKKYSLMTRFMNDVSTRPRIQRSHSFSGSVKQISSESEPSSVMKNLFDIPVSPKLKSRVRQRLYTLVNSIDGYQGKINIEEEEENIRKLCLKTVESVSNSKVNISASTQTNANLIVDSKGKPHRSACMKGDFEDTILLKNNVNNTNVCKCHPQGCSVLNTSDKKHASSLDQTVLSTLSHNVSEKYGSVMSSLLESQMRTLQLHQEQLNQEKLSLAMQKKDHEAQARISVYQEKLQLMIQMVEELEFKLSEMQKKMRDQAEYYQHKIKKQDEVHKESLAVMRMECEKKMHELESRILSVRKEMTQSCDQNILAVLSSTQEKATVIEKEHEAHILQLNSVISKLRADKRELEFSLENSYSNPDNKELDANIAEICNEKDSLKQEIDTLKQRLKAPCDTDETVVALQEDISNLEIAKRLLQEEVDVWKKESETLQQKLSATELGHKKLLDEALQGSHLLAKQEVERLQIQNTRENERLNKTITLLKEKQSQALSENLVLRQQNSQLLKVEKDHKEYSSSRETLEKEVASLRSELQQAESQVLQQQMNFKRLQKAHANELTKYQEAHRQRMLNYQVSMERERSSAVSQALARQQEETKILITEVGSRYENLLGSVQAHAKAQMHEYKKIMAGLLLY
ncbi:TATA element modulatory factor-like isoform X2 [Homarus americanus]|uniref:TATA element modulatory factor-like isoform X2 n=1 Tax=Homarus americanus TaxID=6706 RepID=UPI001C463161|nr:TATA element modulatory factor-like isoform X2 [Homarus americanus]